MGKGKHRRVKPPEATGARTVRKAFVGLVSGVAVAGGPGTALADGAGKSQASDIQHSRADVTYEDLTHADVTYGEDNEPSEYTASDIAPHGVPAQVERDARAARGSEAAQPAEVDCDARAKSTRQLIQELSPECRNSTAERRAAAQELGNRGTFVSDPATNMLFFQPVDVAPERLDESRAMPTQELIDRLTPQRDVSQDERNAAFLGLQDRGFQIFDPQTRNLQFNPQVLVGGGAWGDRSAPGGQSAIGGQSTPGGSQLPVKGVPGAGRSGVTEASSPNQAQAQAPAPAPTPGPNPEAAPAPAPLPAPIAAPVAAPAPGAPTEAFKGGVQQAAEPIVGGRIEIPTGTNSFVFIQGGVNSKILSISGGGGVGAGGNRSFVGAFPAPPTGINLRGDVSLVSPAANVKGEARVNFNPVTQEFSGGGSGEIQVNGPGGDALSGKVSLDVQPDGEIKFTDSNGGAIDLGGRKLSVTPSQPTGDGSRSAPSFRFGLAGGPADDKGFRVEGRIEADATANVPLDDEPQAAPVTQPTGLTDGPVAPDNGAATQPITPSPDPAGTPAAPEAPAPESPALEARTPEAPAPEAPAPEAPAPEAPAPEAPAPEAPAPETPAPEAPAPEGPGDFGGGGELGAGGADFGSGGVDLGGGGAEFAAGGADFGGGGADFGGGGGGDFGGGF